MAKKFKVPAECFSDDREVECSFDAVPWLNHAMNKEVVDLAKCRWGGDYPSDAVAIYMAKFDKDIEFMFKYIEHKNKKGSDVGFECRIDGPKALIWLKKNRPTLHAKVLKAIKENE